ncbi:MAG: adenosylcobinamide-GDP ribazoletransferase [Methylomonas sp.]|nr:adenosylcobinamide-GDP ribazoletransferase [Methylomonas sp.]PPD19835.1 MAG: adenosylcobinamide-GDP ribazoletransferase [Methylomonas sp.]PPD26670.1 MAG: adenosylcobinamide-GDP ribazoletransferase [Methylomonas sp.]PPD38478.1 MAG: adenosylcobinamide-GDP ribazoletransferase [Methylomonas sp.]PPD55880.1 MAG: adenosylcobinamide-GDP ribazoletransferase [Methylomonas sp.]
MPRGVCSSEANFVGRSTTGGWRLIDLPAFQVAIQFLTRIPLRVDFAIDDSLAGRSPLYYPAVGGVIGGLLWSAASLLPQSAPAMTAVLLLTFWVVLTGALHLDGLADCADAWVGGHGNRERTFSIMKDPAAGPMAVVALVLVLMLKGTALRQIIEQGQWLPLLMTPVLGRSAILALMLTMPYVSPNGLAAALYTRLPRTAARGVLALSLLLAVVTLGLLPVVLTALLVLAVRTAAMRRLGGATGDVYGAAVELGETALLVALAL